MIIKHPCCEKEFAGGIKQNAMYIVALQCSGK